MEWIKDGFIFLMGAWVGCGVGILIMCMLQLRKDDFDE